MKKLNIYIFALSALTLAFSCVRIEEENFTAPATKVEMTFSATMADGAQTKTAVDGVAGDAVRNLLWLPEDEIAIISTDGGDVEHFHNNLNERAQVASFSGTAVLSDSYYGLFPYQSTLTLTESTLRFKLPATQMYGKESFGPKAMPMVAKVSDGEELYFKNVCGGFIVNLTGTEKIKSIQFTGYDETGNKAKVSGEFTVNMNYEEVPEIQVTGNGNTNVTLNCGDGVQLSEDASTSFHIALPPASYHGFTLVITTTDGKRMIKESEKELTISRANLTNAAAFAFEENFFGFDLSEKGTANSYIISAEGFYYFDASVIGNGEFGMKNTLGGAWAGATDLFHTDNPTISPASAELLWESTEGMITGVSYKDGEISFSASGAEGNALIVAKNDNDEIIWSWHIWSTDEPQDHLYVNNLGNYTIMDRNLGATRADRGNGNEYFDAIGMLYQFGRKDPFYVSIKQDHGTYADYEGHFESIRGQFSTEQSIKNPNTFAYGNNDWNTSSSATQSWSGTSKSIYDPCPVGYRVATSDAWYGFTTNGSYTNSMNDIMFAGEWNCGAYFYYDGINTAWYSANVWIDNWGSISHGDYYKKTGHIWTSNNNNSVYYLFDSEYNCYFNRNNWNESAFGFPVRCMKDEKTNSVIVTTTEVSNVSTNSADVTGRTSVYGDIEVIETGFVYGETLSVTIEDGTVISTGNETGEMSAHLSGLKELTKYYVKAFVRIAGVDEPYYGSTLSFITPNAEGIVNLSIGGTANSYMVYPVQGTYKFDMVQGNSSTSVGNVASVEVLWETLNTTESVSVGDVIESVEIEGAIIKFSIPENAKAGNALIGAKNSAGKILWSWHIWVVDFDADATGIVYPSGYMFMDRNLGALTEQLYRETSDPMVDAGGYNVRSFGLFYQWGRKDPFVGTGDEFSSFATTTMGEKSYIESGSDTDTKAYAISHPTTVISNSSWNRDETLWGMQKTIYDPCPVGWRVPSQEAWDNMKDSHIYLLDYPRAGYTAGYAQIYYGNSGYFLWTSNFDGYNGRMFNSWNVHFDSHSVYYEQSVRCVKDANFILITNEATGVTENAATLSGSVEIHDNTRIEERGFIYRENSDDLNTNDSNVKTIKVEGNGDSFTKAITGLKPNTTYYFKAYAKGNYNTRYGEIRSFKTKTSGSGDGFNDGGDYEWE